jgi:hypothetical protein
VTKEPGLPVRLPGRFAVRGDWFLAVAGGSRSGRLARRALDLFSSRRANFRRLELGIGLPTRDIASPEMVDLLQTALVKRDRQGRTVAVTYGELIGCQIHKLPHHFGWFWRSQLRNYHRHSRLWQRWIAQMVAQWEDIRLQFGSKWRNGFDIYDQLEGRPAQEAILYLEGEKLESWTKFREMCRLLERQLVIAGDPEADSPAPSEAPVPRASGMVDVAIQQLARKASAAPRASREG